MNRIRNKVVVITGASSGIGRATALEVASRQGIVVLAARNEKALKAVAHECEDAGGTVMVSDLDVTELRGVRKLARKAVEKFGRIDIWVNNAAVTLFARFEEAPPKLFEQVVETNFFGYVNGARAVLPYFREQGEGILINVSSTVGKVGSPYVSAYTASEFAINGWAESLRMELQDAPDVHVCTVLAASIDTPLFQHSANYTGRAVKPLPPVYSPNVVVRAIVNCMERPQREIYAGKTGAMVSALRMIAPGLAEKVLARQVERQHFKDEAGERTDGILFDSDDSQYSVDGGWGGQENAPGKGGKLKVAGGLVALTGLGAAAAYVLNQRGGASAAEKASEMYAKARESIPEEARPQLGKVRGAVSRG